MQRKSRVSLLNRERNLTAILETVQRPHRARWRPWHSEPNNVRHGAARHVWRNRVGGGLIPAALPHHRTYGSLCGGSCLLGKRPQRVAFRSSCRTRFQATTLASADFGQPIPTPYDVGSTQGRLTDLPEQDARPSRLCLSDLRRSVPCEFRALTIWVASPATPPLSASCSSGQRFAYSFLQIPNHSGHPCRSAILSLAGCVEDFHLQVIRLATTAGRTAPVTALRAMSGAPKKTAGETPAASLTEIGPPLVGGSNLGAQARFGANHLRTESCPLFVRASAAVGHRR